MELPEETSSFERHLPGQAWLGAARAQQMSPRGGNSVSFKLLTGIYPIPGLNSFSADPH